MEGKREAIILAFGGRTYMDYASEANYQMDKWMPGDPDEFWEMSYDERVEEIYNNIDRFEERFFDNDGEFEFYSVFKDNIVKYLAKD